MDPSGEGPLSLETSATSQTGPSVIAGPNQTLNYPFPATLAGSVTEGLIPPGHSLSSTWSKVSGPGNVTFANISSPATTANFSTPGAYVLQLTGSDGIVTNTSQLTITVNPDPGPTVTPAQTKPSPSPPPRPSTDRSPNRRWLPACRFPRVGRK